MFHPGSTQATTTDYCYASCGEGGLLIPSLLCPCLCAAATGCWDLCPGATPRISSILIWQRRFVSVICGSPRDPSTLGLRTTSRNSGSGYVHCHKVRKRSPTTKSSTNRGKHGDGRCLAGCLVPKSNNHMLQICHDTNVVIFKRDIAVAAYICRNLRGQGFTLEKEFWSCFWVKGVVFECTIDANTYRYFGVAVRQIVMDLVSIHMTLKYCVTEFIVFECQQVWYHSTSTCDSDPMAAAPSLPVFCFFLSSDTSQVCESPLVIAPCSVGFSQYFIQLVSVAYR